MIDLHLSSVRLLDLRRLRRFGGLNLILPLLNALLAVHVHDVAVPREERGGGLCSPVVEHRLHAVPDLPADFLHGGSGLLDGLYKARLLAGLELLEKLVGLLGHGFSLSLESLDRSTPP